MQFRSKLGGYQELRINIMRFEIDTQIYKIEVKLLLF